MEKACSTCKRMKPLDDFHRSKSFKDGRAYVCKPCSREAQAKYRRENADTVSESRRRWYENNKSKHSQLTEAHREKMKKETSATAKNKSLPWAIDDDAMVLREDLTLTEISKALGRTYASCAVRRSTLRGRQHQKDVVAEVQRRITRADQ